MPTTSSARAVLSPALVVLAAACVLLAGAVALAGPAAAIEDPRRPTAEVTHGPSCGPGVIRVAVTNGTQPHRVALVFDGAQEEDSAVLANGEQAELVSSDIDWGETVDVAVTVAAADGTAEEPLQFGTYTRPSAEDCAAVTPTTPETSPPASTPESSPPTSPETAPTSATPSTTSTTSSSTTRPSTPSTVSGPTSTRPSGSAPPATPGTPRPTAPGPAPDGAADASSGQAGSASASSVSPGGVVTVRATGFTPGEPVTVSMLGVAAPLTTVTAGADGSVEAVVQIPRGAALGTATVHLVGGLSDATAGLPLKVAARTRPVVERTTSVPVLAAGIALIGAAGGLSLMAARRPRGHRTTRR
ncbi:MAG TPA: hypothetical protein VGO95_06120 [Modestobacter sp.]|nr:hypothetical protein [Modestobacter sp.]